MKIGVQAFLGEDMREKFKKVRDMGFDNCQLTNWNKKLHTDEMAKLVNEAAEEFGIEITAYWCGWSGLSWSIFI